MLKIKYLIKNENHPHYCFSLRFRTIFAKVQRKQLHCKLKKAFNVLFLPYFFVVVLFLVQQHLYSVSVDGFIVVLCVRVFFLLYRKFYVVGALKHFIHLRSDICLVEIMFSMSFQNDAATIRRNFFLCVINGSRAFL